MVKAESSKCHQVTKSIYNPFAFSFRDTCTLCLHMWYR